MVRVLIVYRDSQDPNFRRLAAGLSQLEVSGCSPNVSIEDVEILNPHCVLNIGSIDGDSVFWSLPMWRRRRWLDVPDFNVSPLAIRQSLLSLLNSSIQPGVFEPWPTIDVWCPCDITLRELVRNLSKQTYDNWKIHKSGQVERNSNAEQVLAALAISLDGYLWVNNGAIEDLSSEFLEDLVTLIKDCEQPGSIVVSDLETPMDILENISSHQQSTIRHILIHRETLFAGRAAPHLLPLQGLIGVMTKVLSHPATRIISTLGGRSFDDELLMNRADAIDLTLSQGPVQWNKWVCEEQANLVSSTT